MNKKLISLIFVGFLSTNILFAQATDDNEIRIDQEGDTLTLLIDQVGFGNKISQTDAYDDKMVITGTTLNIDIDQIGNQNKIFYSSPASISSRIEYNNSKTVFFTLSLSVAIQGRTLTFLSIFKAIRKSSVVQESGKSCLLAATM